MYQLIPRGLKSRLERERKKRFQAQQREAVTAATAALAAWQRRHEGGSGTLTAAQEKEGKDLKDRLQTLKDLEEKREDLGERNIAVPCTQLVSCGVRLEHRCCCQEPEQSIHWHALLPSGVCTGRSAVLPV